MLDKEVFIDYLTELQAFYKREFSHLVQKVWYRRIAAELNTEQFVQAVETALLKFQYMPTAEELIELVKGDIEARAMDEWGKIIYAAQRINPNWSMQDSFEFEKVLMPESRLALKSMGGLNAIAQCEETKLEWKRKEFIQACQAFSKSSSTLLLEAGAERAQIAPATEEERENVKQVTKALKAAPVGQAAKKGMSEEERQARIEENRRLAQQWKK